MTARKTLDVYDWALGREENKAKYKLFKNQYQ
jgi:D-inositol-3-phosphate glycosyltransferase